MAASPLKAQDTPSGAVPSVSSVPSPQEKHTGGEANINLPPLDQVRYSIFGVQVKGLVGGTGERANDDGTENRPIAFAG